MSGINPNAAFTRVTCDIPTPVALAMDATVKASGKSKKQWLADLIAANVSTSNDQQTTTSKRKQK